MHATATKLDLGMIWLLGGGGVILSSNGQRVSVALETDDMTLWTDSLCEGLTQGPVFRSQVEDNVGRSDVIRHRGRIRRSAGSCGNDRVIGAGGGDHRTAAGLGRGVRFSFMLHDGQFPASDEAQSTSRQAEDIKAGHFQRPMVLHDEV